MFKNYFKITIRNLGKNIFFPVLNIFGLIIGLACCILMLLFIRNELRYDKFNVHDGDIYPVTSLMYSQYEKTNLAVAPSPWAQRKKAHIRKTADANTARIITELPKDFLRPVYIASIIAVPIAWHEVKMWLRDFTYRLVISWWIFLAQGAVSVLIALMAVSLQAIRTAIARPLK